MPATLNITQTMLAHKKRTEHDAEGAGLKAECHTDTDDFMKIVRNSVETDKKSRIQEKCVSVIIITITILTGFLFYMGVMGISAHLFSLG